MRRAGTERRSPKAEVRRTGPSSPPAPIRPAYAPQHLFHFFPLPQEQGSFLPIVT
jgi:hypothetical protein